MQFSEVLKERDLQIEMKKRIEKMRQNDENDVQKRFEESQIEFDKGEKEKVEPKRRFRFFFISMNKQNRLDYFQRSCRFS